MLSTFGLGGFFLVFLLVFLLVLLFVGGFLFIALGLERRSFVRLQRDGEDAVGGVVVVPLVELPGARVKVACRNEVQIFPGRLEDRVAIVVEASGSLGDFLRAQRIKKNVARAAPVRLRISKPQAVRRPACVRNIPVFALVHKNRLLLFDADVPELMQLVPVNQLLAVRGPYRPVPIDSAITRDARLLAAHLRTRIHLIFTGLVREVRNRFAIGRPRRIQFVNARVFRGQRADAAVLCRNSENVSARLHHRSCRGRRQRVAPNILGNILEFRPRFDTFRMHGDGNFARFVARKVVFAKHSAVFINDGVGPKARPLDVVFLVIREFLCLLRSEVVAVEIHHAVAVADEINGVPVPHGEHVHALGFGQLLIGVAFQVVDGDGQVPTAVVTLPGAKFLRSFDVGDLGSVRRERSQVTAGNRQHLRRASLRRHQEKFREAAWRRAEPVRAEENVFAVGRPAKNDVV